MKIALINGKNGVGNLIKAFENLGHEVVCAEGAFIPLASVDAIYDCGAETSRSYKKLNAIAYLANKPVLNFHWCCRHLAALLNHREGNMS